jgi:dihydrofolate reductase/thymidylate synthase
LRDGKLPLTQYHLYLSLSQPWKLPGDMAYFKRVTTEAPPQMRNALIMGRKTWESIPPNFRPLPGRINVVLSKNKDLRPECDDDTSVLVASSLADATQKLELQFSKELHSIFVIGGAQIYQQALDEDVCNKVLLTEVSNLPEGLKYDAFFPALDESDGWFLVEKHGKSPNSLNDDAKENKSNVNVSDQASNLHTDKKTGATYRFLEYDRSINTEEMQYLDLCRDIIENGVRRGDRTGTGTLSKFGTQMRFSLRDGTLPLLTTKRTFWRGVAEELLWFVSVRY